VHCLFRLDLPLLGPGLGEQEKADYQDRHIHGLGDEQGDQASAQTIPLPAAQHIDETDQQTMNEAPSREPAIMAKAS
jgi:hypothetical protein